MTLVLSNRFKVLLLILPLIVLVNCASTAKLSKQGKEAYVADEVVRSLGLLQSATIEANNDGLVKTEDARAVVTYVKAAVLTAKEVPNGWRVVLGNGLTNLQSTLPPDTARRLLPYFNTIRAVLAEL